MTKSLIIAEKPSVAVDIAKALGQVPRQGDFFENDEVIVASAVGHLLELTVPDEYEVKRGKWSFTHLPVLPPHFSLKPIDKTAERLRLLLRLIKRKDVGVLVNACDAGREGELIFRYLAQYAKTDKPIRRLWLQSMTPASIRDGFAHLRSDGEMQPLADAARCRSEADWLIGINGTRAMTAFNSAGGGFYKTPVGRVQTPTLAILVEREKRIRAFRSKPFWEVEAEFQAVDGSYRGRWIDLGFRREDRDDEHARAERIWVEGDAVAVQARCQGKPATATDESKPTTQLSPLLFDLTSLQREANARFGFSAKNTLGLAQALYEKHKVLTYPRTDSRYLPEDYIATVKETLGVLGSTAYARFANEVAKSGWVHPNKRIFNNAKVSDHFAIIPTALAPKQLSEPEQKLYDLVVKRFLAVFYPAAEHLVTTRITRIGDDAFKTDGKILVAAGWLTVYGKGEQDDDAQLVKLGPDERVWANEVTVKANETKPPARFTEATLLSAMEGAGKLIDDEELRAAMSAKGLGTPATRAATIEGLIYEEYVHREGRELVPTAKADSLLFALEKLGVDEVRSPELTGHWEYQLKQMEAGSLQRDAFMEHIVATTSELVDRIKNGQIPDEAFRTLEAPCPKCGGVVQENYRKFLCKACDFSLWRVVASRQLEPEEVSTLLQNRSVGPLQGFRSKMGRPFAAILKLNAENGLEFDFGQNRDDEEGAEAPDFSGQEPLGACPKCQSKVYEHGLSYVCEQAVGPDRKCDFRSGKIILQQTVETDEMRKLLRDGRTSLLKNFVSQRTRRKFSAYLVRSPEGKVVFEFEKREPRKTAGGAAKKPSGEAAEAAAPKKAAAKAKGKSPTKAESITAKRAAASKTTAKARKTKSSS
ncbi:MAG TPA: DNA topoisomerase III [Rhodocyclaceae bacterium]